ncbi:hypothetical protein NMY22_g7396 [Coprinellus aureogranulatus]|nr:hypothetical protein NMY22_g7396 [Coprinellus aureogranulatus]
MALYLDVVDDVEQELAVVVVMERDQTGNPIAQEPVRQTEALREKLEGICKNTETRERYLALALQTPCCAGDHSALYIAANISSSTPVTPDTTKAYLVQTFLRLIMAYTGLQGYCGVDEEEIELTLSFWYIFQEALWSADYFEDEDDDTPPTSKGPAQVTMAKNVYIELVQILRGKVAFPPSPTGWHKDQIDKFNVYRRDVWDTIINAFCVLRDDMLSYYINELLKQLNSEPNWQDVEATLHRVTSIQEAVDLEKAPQPARVFSQDILRRLPTSGHNRLRKTALSVIDTYSTWFMMGLKATEGLGDSTLLLNVLNYVVTALTDHVLCLQAAVALRNLCDINRKAPAPHILAFGQLHNGLEDIPDSEKSKVLQSIASVIQALPPQEMISPVEAIVSPTVQKLVAPLQTAAPKPEEARSTVTLQLEILAGISKGLTRTTGSLYGDDEEDPSLQAEIKQIKIAREDPRMRRIRDDTFSSIRNIVGIWSVDAEISHLCSILAISPASSSDRHYLDIFTSRPASRVDLRRGPETVDSHLPLPRCYSHRTVEPSTTFVSLEAAAKGNAEAIVANVLPILLQCGLSALAVPGAMEANPNIVQEFFSCMDRVHEDLPHATPSPP